MTIEEADEKYPVLGFKSMLDLSLMLADAIYLEEKEIEEAINLVIKKRTKR